jgi:putative membrane protein
MDYQLHLLCKALHIVGFVSWFAGLFYIVRLFIYHVESVERPAAERVVLHEQFVLMERRLWKVITVPAMVVTMIFGGLLGYSILAPQSSIFAVPWLLVKIGLVFVLLGYHLVCGRILRQLAAGTCRWTAPQLRQWNEVATLLLVAIVMIAVFKNLFGALWGTLGLVALGVVLGIAVRVMRNRWAKPGQQRAG